MQIRMLSYNIHRAIGLDRRFRPERIISVLDHYQADIVLLQEVDVGVPRSRKMDMAKELAEALDYRYYAVGLNVKVKQGHYGNATLSRFPVIEDLNIDLTVDRRKKRGCLYTLLSVPGDGGATVTLPVFNLHLGLSAQERIRQLGILVQSGPYSGLDKEQACVIGGDFNDWRTFLSPIMMDILGFECATNRKSGHSSPLETYPSFSPTGGLDKVFYRGNIKFVSGRRCRLGVSKVASDHLPVIVDFNL